MRDETTTVPAAIRRLAYGDLDRVLEIEQAAFSAPWSLAMFMLELSKSSTVSLAAIRKGVLCGYLICSRYDTVWHIMNLSVAPDYRRRGVASSLLQGLFDRIDDSKARYTLEVRESNLPGLELYRQNGFLAAGMRRNYYRDNGESAVIMWRTPSTLKGCLDDVPAVDELFVRRHGYGQ